jgi:hypothetical protein
MNPDWPDVPAHMRRMGRRLDRHRRTMLLSIAAVWIALFALFFSVGAQIPRARAVAIWMVMPLAFIGMWTLYLWAWSVRPVPASPSLWRRVEDWIQSIFIVVVGVMLATMSWSVARMFLRP